MDAKQLLKELDTLKGERSKLDRTFEQIAEHVCPSYLGFIGHKDDGDKKTNRIFDSTASLGLSRFGSSIESLVTPRTSTWHSLQPIDPELEDDQEIKTYLDEVTKIMFRVRYGAKSNFAQQAHELYLSLGAFGTGCMFVDDGGLDQDTPILYRHIPLHELHIKEDFQGMVDCVYRSFQLTARQAAQQFGLEGLPEKIQRAYETQPHQKFDFVHHVRPNVTMDEERLDAQGMPIKSYYISVEGAMIIQEGGYSTMPYMVPRYEVVGGPYGRSPSMTILPDILTVNEISKTLLRVGQRMAEPPLLLQEDGSLDGFDLSAGALNYGGIDDIGRQLVQPLQINGNLPVGLELLQDRRKAINEAYLVNLFQILVDSPQKTATEAMILQQEKGALLAPMAGRVSQEFLGVLIDRELDLLSKNGLLPPMPEALIGAGGLVKASFESPALKAQQADEGVGIMRTLEASATIAQFEPNIVQIINAQEAIRRLAEVNGAPPDILKSNDELEQEAEAKAQQEQMQQVLQSAPLIGKTAESLAKAQQMEQMKGTGAVL